MTVTNLRNIVVYSFWIIIVLGFVYVYHFVGQIKFPPSSVTDITQYKSILKKWKESVPDIVSHFPETIPTDVQNVEFYFYPGFLQSDSRIELRYRTTPENMQNLYDEFSKRKTISFQGGIFGHYPPGGGDADIIELGVDWEIMHFEEDPDNLPEGSKVYGVMISREKNEIIYWAQW